jgi:hypothetical protein
MQIFNTKQPSGNFLWSILEELLGTALCFYFTCGHTVTMATPPTISMSNGTDPSKQKSRGTGTLTTNCLSRLILWIICSMVFTVFAPFPTCRTCFFNATNRNRPHIRYGQST